MGLKKIDKVVIACDRSECDRSGSFSSPQNANYSKWQMIKTRNCKELWICPECATKLLEDFFGLDDE